MDARDVFDQCLREEPEDLATQRHLQFMGKHNFEAPSNWKGVREVSGSSFEVYEPEKKTATSRRLTLTVTFKLFCIRYIYYDHACIPISERAALRLQRRCPASTSAAFSFGLVSSEASASDRRQDAQDYDITAAEGLTGDPRPSRSESTTTSDMTGSERRFSTCSREFGDLREQSESEIPLPSFAQVPSPVLTPSAQVSSQR